VGAGGLSESFVAWTTIQLDPPIKLTCIIDVSTVEILLIAMWRAVDRTFVASSVVIGGVFSVSDRSRAISSGTRPFSTSERFVPRRY